MSFFQKLILWMACTLAIAGLTVIVVYWLARWIAAMLFILLIGGFIGIPLALITKSYYKKNIENIKKEVDIN